MYHRHVFHYSVVIRWFGKNRARPVEDLQHCPISKFNYWKTITVSSSFNRREIYTGSLYHTTTIPQYEKSITANSLSTGFLMPEIRTRYTVQNFGHLPGNLRAMLFIRSQMGKCPKQVFVKPSRISLYAKSSLIFGVICVGGRKCVYGI